MSNEQYLFLTYFGTFMLSILVGFVIYFYLKKSINTLTDDKRSRKFGPVIKRVFIPGSILPLSL